jgi:asparagine synthase (glutamine-hydrolysing)
MYLNYREATRFVKVLLIGEGADECFAGYSRYKLLHPRLPLPKSVRADLYERVYMYADRQPRNLAARVVSTGLWGRPPASPLAHAPPSSASPLANGLRREELMGHALYHDQRTYLHNLSLKRADAMGMAHSVELRVPFLDHRVVELAARIPASLLLRRGMEKYILRRALEPLLPHEVAWRRKRGIQMRLGLGLVDALDDLYGKLLSPADVRARGFFDADRVQALWRGRPGRHAMPMAHKVWSYRVWAMLMCELWARIFLDRPACAGPPESLAELT